MSGDPDKKVKLLFDCLDWRLHPQIENYFKEHFGDCDLCVTAGSIKGFIDLETRNFFLEQIGVSKKLHRCAGVILTMHMDCGAFGGSDAFGGRESELAHHKGLMEKARGIINQAYPEMKVDSFIIDLKKDGGGWLAQASPAS